MFNHILERTLFNYRTYLKIKEYQFTKLLEVKSNALSQCVSGITNIVFFVSEIITLQSKLLP